MDMDQAAEKIKKQFPDSVIDVCFFRGETTVTIQKNKIIEILKCLRDDPELSYDFLSDLCGIDYYPRKPRYEVVYNLFSIKNAARLRIKVPLDADDAKISSVVSLWKTANWQERECYDLLGIRFEGHPDLRRILMPEDATGHPLRKDYPLRGERDHEVRGE